MKLISYDTYAVEDLNQFRCESLQDILTHFQKGLKNRVISSHKLNQASSRSHSIFTITVDSISADQPDIYNRSHINFVDLAGSERHDYTKSKQSEKVNKEAIEINKSLFNLKKVIEALSENFKGKKKGYVPFRESKLTSLLRQSIGGNSYCVLIACTSPLE